MSGPDDDEAALRRLDLVERLYRKIKDRDDEIDSLRARLTEAEEHLNELDLAARFKRERDEWKNNFANERKHSREVTRERDEALTAIDLLGGTQENLQKQIIALRHVANDWHDEYVRASEMNLANLGESSKARSALRARIAALEDGLRQALDQLNHLGFADMGLDALLTTDKPAPAPEDRK